MFKITRDYICDDVSESAVGTVGRHTPYYPIIGGADPLPDRDPIITFRLWDDDGELYYEGLLHDDDQCENQLTALKWGELEAGCTTIKVRRAGGWIQEIG